MDKKYHKLIIIGLIAISGLLIFMAKRYGYPAEDFTYSEDTNLDVDLGTLEGDSEDEISLLLKEILDYANVKAQIQEANFIWNQKNAEDKMERTEVYGKGVLIPKITDQERTEIENYLDDNGFDINLYNVSAGTIGAGTGYIRNNVVCLVTHSIKNIDEKTGLPMDKDNIIREMEIKCGIYEN